MTQTLYPTADVSLGTWTNPTWSVVDDDSDSDYSDSGNVRLGDQVCDLHGGNLTDPAVNTSHVITVRAKYSTNNSRVGRIKVELKEAGTVRATLALVDLTTSFTEKTYTLSSAEADAISNYQDLHLQCTGAMKAGGAGTVIQIQMSSVKFTCPDAPAGGHKRNPVAFPAINKLGGGM